MLFYERVEKKPIKLVVSDDLVDNLKAELGEERFAQELDNENHNVGKLITTLDMPFMPHIIDNDVISTRFFRMNELYRGVMDENQKVTF